MYRRYHMNIDLIIIIGYYNNNGENMIGVNQVYVVDELGMKMCYHKTVHKEIQLMKQKVIWKIVIL